MFGFGKKSTKKTPFILPADREWVEANFKWLIQVYNYPNPTASPVLLTPDYFPYSLGSNEIEVDVLLKDLVNLFDLKNVTISYSIQEDLRDMRDVPLHVVGKITETYTEITKSGYNIQLSSNVLKYPKRLLYNLIQEHIFIRLKEDQLNFESGEDSQIFLLLAGIFMRFGVILSQGMLDTGIKYDSAGLTRWNNPSELPLSTMMFALALYATLSGDNNLYWRNYLPNELRQLFDEAVLYLEDFPSELFNKNELEAFRLFQSGCDLYNQHAFAAAISEIENIPELTENNWLVATVYNNIGYYSMRIGDIAKSIPYFKKALDIDPEFGYANDNLGYALIQSGEHEEGLLYLEKALKTGNNDIAYSHRNKALYYVALGDNGLAETYFQHAFDTEVLPVDLLEYHYSLFLTALGNTEKAIKYLRYAIEKGEPEAIQLAHEKGISMV